MRPTIFLSGAGVLILGGVVGWLLKPTNKPRQVTGDPPITVSDGSLHAHSLNGWRTNGSMDTTIRPPLGHLSNSCLMVDSKGNPTSASLWADDTIFDIAMGATITIYHDPGDASSENGSTVTIQVPIDASPADLSISTTEGYFEKDKASKNGKHNREHSRPGEVEKIVISNPPNTWTPQNPHNPHFSLLFCYQ